MLTSRLLPTPAALAWSLVACLCLCLVTGCAGPARERHETYEGNTARLSDLVPPPPPASSSGFHGAR